MKISTRSQGAEQSSLTGELAPLCRSKMHPPPNLFLPFLSLSCRFRDSPPMRLPGLSIRSTPCPTHRDFSLFLYPLQSCYPIWSLYRFFLSLTTGSKSLFWATPCFLISNKSPCHLSIRSLVSFLLPIFPSIPVTQSLCDGSIKSGQAARSRRAKVSQLPSPTQWSYSGWRAKTEPVFLHHHQRS